MSAEVLCMAWTRTSHRVVDLAEALGGTAVLVHPSTPGWLRHPLSTALRHLLSLFVTTSALRRHRPTRVVVTNPPLWGPLLVAVWASRGDRRFVVDSHPSAFGAKGKHLVARLQPVHRWLARRASGVLVTTPARKAEVDDWGAHGIVLHEPPVDFPAPLRGTEPIVLFVGVFAQDEPVHDVVEAARALPEVTFRVTGDVGRAPEGLVRTAPGNVEFVGLLSPEDYRQAVVSASVVLTLTTEPSSVMRSAYEAVYARMPMVLTGTDDLRALFPHAVACDNTASSIAASVRLALDSLDQLVALAEDAARLQEARWDGQLTALLAACRP